jgi:hypothetical protein
MSVEGVIGSHATGRRVARVGFDARHRGDVFAAAALSMVLATTMLLVLLGVSWLALRATSR